MIAKERNLASIPLQAFHTTLHQNGLLGKNGLLLIEHLLSSKLVAEGQDLWVNPNHRLDDFDMQDRCGGLNNATS